MNFSELVDISELGKLCESFTAINGAATAILDLEGNILAATGWQEICTRFHRVNPSTASRCRESDTVLAGLLGKGERYNVYKCKNGLIDVAVPIVIGGEHVANFFTGQFLFEPPDKDHFIRQAEEFGFDKELYLEALNNVPIFSEDKIRSMMEFFTRLAQLIGEMGAARKNLMETNAELRHSEERYRGLYNETPVMLHSIDHEGRLVSVSNYWLETLGYQRSEVLGRLSAEFLTEASRRYATEVVLPEFFRTGSCKEVPYQVVKKSGEVLDVLLSAIVERDSAQRVVRTLAVMVDVTERKRAEEALQESEAKFSRAFQAVPSLLAITTLDEGRYIEANEAFERITGYRRNEVIGRTSLEIKQWNDSNDRSRIIGMLREGKKVRDQEIKFVTKFGTVYTGLYSAEIIEFQGEECLLSLVNDITARKQAEEEVQRLNLNLAERTAELEAAYKEQEAFNHTVAHDLRQPLNLLSSYCQIIDKQFGNQIPEQCLGYVRNVNDATLRMNRMIEALLNFSHMCRVEPRRELVDLSLLAQEVSLSLKMTESGRQIDFRIADGIVAHCDANLLRSVLENLLGNACKYTGTREKAMIEFGTREIDGVTAYFVRDNGTGFERNDAERIFTPFQRLPGSEKCRGSGIGLATVERIIRRHGGKVWAEGEPDQGACIYFTLCGPGLGKVCASAVADKDA